jgi:hypothetical protein
VIENVDFSAIEVRRQEESAVEQSKSGIASSSNEPDWGSTPDTSMW